ASTRQPATAALTLRSCPYAVSRTRVPYASYLTGLAVLSVLPQVPPQLPLAHPADIGLPLLALRFDEPLVDVRAQRVPHHVVLLEHLQRLVQVPRQLIDAVLAALPEAHFEDVLVDRIGGEELALDTVQPRRQLDRQGEVGVRRRIGHPQLAARAHPAPIGDADQGRPVPHRPRHGGRRLVPRDEPLVADDEW